MSESAVIETDPTTETPNEHDALTQPVATAVEGATAANVPENPVARKLFLVVQEVQDEINKIDRQIESLNEQKSELLKLLHQYGGSPAPAASTNGKHPATPKRSRKKRTGQPAKRPAPGEKSVRELIMEYMENNRKATTSEIRNYLDDLGRSTNPGVELGRLVKKGKIKLVERGNYTLVK